MRGWGGWGGETAALRAEDAERQRLEEETRLQAENAALQAELSEQRRTTGRPVVPLRRGGRCAGPGKGKVNQGGG